MKPFWGIDITENKKNERMNGEELLVQKVSKQQEARFESALKETEHLANRSQLPLVFRIVQGGCGFAAPLIFAGIMKSLGNGTTLEQGYANAPYLFWIIGVCAVVWLILTLIGKKRNSDGMESREGTDAVYELDNAAESAYAELGVPAGLPDTDVLVVTYRLKDDEIRTKDSLTKPPYVNFNVKVFADDKNLYIADVAKKYAVPLSSLRGIREVNKAIFIPNWNKDTPPNKGSYKRMKLTEDNYGRYRVKPYYILEFDHNYELWGIYFPNYELSVFESLTGLKAE